MNTELSEREHARLAKLLISEAGGLDECARVTGLHKSVLSRYSQPHYAETMPARVLHLLESHCGRPVYSSAMFDCFGMPQVTAGLKDIACDLTEKAAEAQTLIRRALTDDRLSPRELADIAALENQLEAAVESLKCARLAAEAANPPPNLRAV